MKKIVLSLCSLLILSACPAEESTQQTQDTPPSGAVSTETHTKTESHSESTSVDHVLPAGHAEAGAKVFMAKGCAACHAISTLPEAKGQIGPSLDGVATRAITRVNGLSAEDYIKQSIEAPESYLVDGYANLMAKGLKDQMSDQEYADLVAYMLTLKS